MSEIRHTPSWTHQQMIANSLGTWVHFAEYDKLQAENKDLIALRNENRAEHTVLVKEIWEKDAEIAQLKAILKQWTIYFDNKDDDCHAPILQTLEVIDE